jgi:hypothetical protein
MYRFATLVKPVEGGVAKMHTWIRSEIAIPGALLDKLKDVETGVIKNGWTVEWVGDCDRPEHVLISKSHRYDDLSKKCDL